MNKRTIVELLIISVMALVLSGCGGGSENPASTSTSGGSSESTQVEDDDSGNDGDPSIQVDSTDDSGNDGDPSTQVDPIDNPSSQHTSYYGNWKYIHDGTVEKIDQNFPYMDDIKRLGDNFIEITKGGTSYMLLRHGSETTIRGQVYNLVKTVQKTDKLTLEKTTHYIPVMQKSSRVKNLRVTINDGFRVQTQKLNADGSFVFSKNNNMGDISIIIDGEKEEEVELEENNITDENNTTNRVVLFDEILTVGGQEDIDLGNFYVPETVDVPDENVEEGDTGDKEEPTYNFKTTQVLDVQDEDDRYMYETRTYTGKLVFKNTGNEVATALNYTIRTNDPYVESLTHDMVMGSVEANQSVEIPFEVTYRILDKIKHRVKLDFIIRDVQGKEWLDNAYLDVYQTPVWVNLKTKTSQLKGYFITPEHEVIDIDTKDIRVKLPRRPDANYYFVVSSPATIGEETAYSLGVDVNASDFEGFNDTSAFEPNDTEESAAKLEIGDDVKSFIHKGDIDFYTIEFNENLSFTPPPLPFY